MQQVLARFDQYVEIGTHPVASSLQGENITSPLCKPPLPGRSSGCGKSADAAAGGKDSDGHDLFQIEDENDSAECNQATVGSIAGNLSGYDAAVDLKGFVLLLFASESRITIRMQGCGGNVSNFPR